MQGTGLVLLTSRKLSARRKEFWFFAAQPFLFPFAFLGTPVLIAVLRDFVVSRVDRETMSDIPFIAAPHIPGG
jgi:hypothetical protein